VAVVSVALPTPSRPTIVVLCPVHGDAVAWRIGDRLLGSCQGCAAEAARAIETVGNGAADRNP